MFPWLKIYANYLACLTWDKCFLNVSPFMLLAKFSMNLKLHDVCVLQSCALMLYSRSPKYWASRIHSFVYYYTNYRTVMFLRLCKSQNIKWTLSLYLSFLDQIKIWGGLLFFGSYLYAYYYIYYYYEFITERRRNWGNMLKLGKQELNRWIEEKNGLLLSYL